MNVELIKSNYDDPKGGNVYVYFDNTLDDHGINDAMYLTKHLGLK